jgi:hypothetical protein
VYARSATIQADIRSIDDGVTYIRDEIMPDLLRVDGCHGLSLLVDRDSGRCIATTAWESAQAMRASAERAERARDRAEQVFGGSLQYEEWEIAAMHRDHPSHDGACVRVTWMQIQPDQIERGLEAYRMSLPELEHFEGFCSTSVLVDRATGRLAASATYESRDALARTRERADTVRTRGVEQAGSRVLDVNEFELAVAHLRVPEMA